jgi:hypothetical protein
MKLRVQWESGMIEILTLVPPVSASLGKVLNHLTDATGLEHWFTDEGFYDGWGKTTDCSEEEADDLIERIEESREIEPGES